ncbi:hypothetical protein GGI07_005688 [Coemansia sp. Benny D115]|nr:hypothetical protein GGI07_005688 [Coemansia sp. Benny D115]
MTVPLVAGPGLRRTAKVALGTPWENNRPLWVFGYGSIIYRVDFAVEAQVFGYIKGRQRAFLQESHDHRGTDTHPGRVCTLIPASQWSHMFPSSSSTKPEDMRCWGMAYKVKSGMEALVKEHLDYREKDGYSIDFVEVYGAHGQVLLSDVMVYVGESSNPSFAGAEPIEQTAAVIARAEGPSGTNREYLFKLCAALREKLPAAVDPYLMQLEQRVKEILGDDAAKGQQHIEGSE